MTLYSYAEKGEHVQYWLKGPHHVSPVAPPTTALIELFSTLTDCTCSYGPYSEPSWEYHVMTSLPCTTYFDVYGQFPELVDLHVYMHACTCTYHVHIQQHFMHNTYMYMYIV